MFNFNRKKTASAPDFQPELNGLDRLEEPELPSPPEAPPAAENAEVHAFPVNPVERHSSKSFFISESIHQGVMSNLSLITAMINGILPENSVNPIEAKEKSEIEDVRLMLEDIERKLVYVDKSLFGG